MYGRGNQAPPFGQGLQRPMLPYQQQHPPHGGHPPHFQPGQSFPPPPQGGPPRFPGFLQAPPTPMNMPQRGPPVPSTGPSYLQPSQHPYPANHQSFTSGGAQNPHHGAPPPSLGPPRVLPPPPPLPQSIPSNQQMRYPPPPPLPPLPQTAAGFFPPPNFESGMTQLPPPPPISSPPRAPPLPMSTSMPTPGSDHVSDQTCQVRTDSNDRFGNGSSSLNQSSLMDLPPPPPKPSDEKIVRNIEVLCQFVAKNGPEFEEMARNKESGNPEFGFLFGGDPGSEASCAREYYLWMKRKCALLNDSDKGQGHAILSQRHGDVEHPVEPLSVDNIRVVHSPADSDVDMEDDITHSDKDTGLLSSVEELNPQPFPNGEVVEMQKQALQSPNDSSQALKLSPSVKSQEVTEPKAEDPTGLPSAFDSPFRLIQSYASDDTSEDEPPGKDDKSLVVLTPSKSRTSNSNGDNDHGSGDFESGEPQTDDKCDRAEPANSDAAFQEITGLGSSGIDASSACKHIEEEHKKNTLTTKVDEFGRRAIEGASESEPDDSHLRRGHRRRERSRSGSRSPSDRRRRRSPWRSSRKRKDRRSRSRSRSRSPGRRRNLSPFRSGADFGGEKVRKGNVEARGGTSKYPRHDMDKSENPRQYRSRQQQDRQSDISSKSPSCSVRPERGGMKDEDRLGGNKLTSNTCDVKNKAEPMSNTLLSDGLHGDVGNMKGEVPDQRASDEPIPHVELQKIVGSITDSSAVQTSAASPSGASVTEPCQGKSSNETHDPNATDPDISHQISTIPPPPSASQATSAPSDSKVLGNYNVMAPSVSLPLQSVSVQSLHPYQSSLPNQQSHYPGPQVSTWAIQPPPLMANPSGLQYQQGSFSVRNDLPNQTSVRTHPGELPGHSQVGGFQYQTHHLHSNNVSGQPMEGPDRTANDRLTQYSSQGQRHSGSFVPPLAPLPVPFTGDSMEKSKQSFPLSNLHMGESSKPTLQNHQFLPQSLPPYGPPLTAADGPSHLGGSVSIPSYGSNLLDRDHPAHLDIGGTRISAHYNPYASTFDQQISSRFSSTAFTQERDAGIKYDSSFGLGHAPQDRQAAVSHDSRQITSSPNSLRAAGHALPRSGGDQYDPLFDSMEPSSKRAQKQDHAADNSDIMLRLSSHHKAMDMTENNKQNEVGAVVASTSLDNDEFGETADAEVGAVENGSPSDSDDDAVVAEGDFEIDQVKPGGKSKKSKDSRSMKLFKGAVANFVKEVLKPQWRQGNMSKEVFKTIVKKTVDKVSGAMKNHRLPKSQAKIDHYIDSSRRKLTQLVEGYVSKYRS